ncbi:MAG: glycerophosphodiester phosphodiesterase [Usitatibacteraceae bacterium]
MTNMQKNWPYPTLFAHRGGGSLAPENTLAAMRTGYEHSYLAVEFDVKLSRDNVALLMHDATLTRTTNGNGCVADTRMSELDHLDAGAWHSKLFRGEPIPHFTVVAKYLRAQGMMANVEIKPCPGREIETGTLVGQLCDELWRDRVVKPLVSSFSIEALRAAHKAATELPIGVLVKVPAAADLQLLRELDAVSIHCDYKHVSAQLVDLFHENGYRVMTYTVNDPDKVSALRAIGVDGIFTDNLEVMAKHFPALLSNAGGS